MAVTLTKKFWNGTQYDAISKIVFTSPNIDSPAAAGTRSHILPGSQYIGTWFEAVDQMYRIKNNQNEPVTQGSYFSEMFLNQATFNFSTDTVAALVTKFSLPTVSGQPTLSGIACCCPTLNGVRSYDRGNNYGTVSNVAANGTVVLDGITYNKYNVTLSNIVGTTTVTGSTTTASGVTTFHVWENDITPNRLWSYSTNSIIFEVEFGEAYNCRLTAWDDETHSTTSNKVLSEYHYKATCCAYKAGGGTKQAPVSNNLVDNMVFPSVVDLPLSGNNSYYGDFDLIHVADGGATGYELGEYLIFTPRLHDMNATFNSGNYDFVTTLHYQYT